MPRSDVPAPPTDLEGWEGWDDYAAFYDWENARTVGRRDVAFWRGVAARVRGRTLELGCGTGRVLAPLVRAGIDVVGVDRSGPMLARARTRLRRMKGAPPVALVRGDVRELPFATCDAFDLVIAPYGLLQSLVRDRDLTRTLESVARVLEPGGLFGIDLVPDVPNWREYSRRVTLRGRGRRGVPITLVESVRQDRARRLTFFDQEFTEGWGRARKVRRFSLAFRTIAVPALRQRLGRAGFEIESVLGSYDGRPWDPRADTWVVLARKRRV
jgi:SAM-dependent methyltransferase